MTEPMGYFDILLQTIEIFTLIGFLVLFFGERSTYGRDSIGRESWFDVLLYNIATAGAYGVYWRLKVTYALHSRDRLASWQWVFVLLTVFVLYMTAPKVIALLTIWDFAIGRRVTKITGQPFSWLLTFIFGHLYLASLVEREASLLPLDFRVPHPARRQRIIRIYSAVAALTLVGIGLAYWNLVEQRQKEFDRIPAQALERSGHWLELHEKYETMFSVDKNGRRDVHTWTQNPHQTHSGEWARYQVDTKFHAGQLYTYSWFSCIEQYEVIEIKEGQLVLKNSAARTLIENRMEMETFADRLKILKENSMITGGWQWGELLKSPWGCEWRFIPDTWENSWNSLKLEIWDRAWN